MSPGGRITKHDRCPPPTRSFADGLIAEEVDDLWEAWMRQADQVLEDDVLLSLIQQELALRFKKGKTRGRPGTPAEVVLRNESRMAVKDSLRPCTWSFVKCP
jgi:hypothetical protein